ncbi:MAG TPA: acyltransferase [Candidatus Hydrogenedentes bacterium]|nr:acyltransferase [Candidatus Hydrogenedentota bacterium]
MNKLSRTWSSWRHARKFAVRGRGNEFAFPDLLVQGHVEIGSYCRFRNNVVLRAVGEGKIVIGNRSGFSWNCLVEAAELVRIGHRTGIAENVVLRDVVYEFFGSAGGSRAVARRSAPIVIGDSCFIGSGCYIGPGVTIGDSAIVAHHSVVTRDIGPLEIWGGRPARRISHRTEGVPESVKREVEELIARFGLREDRMEGRYEY